MAMDESDAPFERVPRTRACLALDDVEHLHGAVGRARSQALSVVVQLGIVLQCAVVSAAARSG